METPKSANLREYCGWTGNTEDDIVTTGTIYHDTASKRLTISTSSARIILAVMLTTDRKATIGVSADRMRKKKQAC